MTTIWVSATVKELQEYHTNGMGLYRSGWLDDSVWAPDDWVEATAEKLIGGYQNFLEVSGHDTLEGLPDDEMITASFEIPDRVPVRPGRPRQRTEPVERSTIDLPTSLWQEIDEAKGAESRRAYIESAIREKLVRDTENVE